MFTRFIIPAVALLGIAFAVYFSNAHGTAETPPPNQLAAPPATPFMNTVAGTGIVEANTRDVEVGSFTSGIIKEVKVQEGDEVKAGDVLFVLDREAAEAELAAAEKAARAAEAAVGSAQASMADEEDKQARVDKLKVGESISEDRKQRQRFSTKRATAALELAKAEAESARAHAQNARVALERMTVKSPIDGRIFKVRVRPGEFISAGAAEAPILMGNDTPLHLRVSIDENDAWRFEGSTKATASLRSNKDINFNLQFVRVEPYVQPKRNLSGSLQEKVDTRVLEVVYSIDNPDNKPLYVGQQMDVFIEAEK